MNGPLSLSSTQVARTEAPPPPPRLFSSPLQPARHTQRALQSRRRRALNPWRTEPRRAAAGRRSWWGR
jgi:hypothetical protein